MIYAEPYTQEDAVMLSRTSIELGAMHTTTYRTMAETAKPPTQFGLPGVGAVLPPAYRFSKLDADGCVAPGTKLVTNDVVMCRTSPQQGCIPTVYRHKEPCIVDTVLKTHDQAGHVMFLVVLRFDRDIEPGDKFSSRHGQKGTLCLITNREDLPFTRDGITPDIVINPHAIPSRMTIGHLIEMMAGKVRDREPTHAGACCALMPHRRPARSLAPGSTPRLLASTRRPRWRPSLPWADCTRAGTRRCAAA